MRSYSYEGRVCVLEFLQRHTVEWEIGLSEQKVVVIQEIKPKVRILILQGLYTFMEVALKLLLNSDLS